MFLGDDEELGAILGLGGNVQPYRARILATDGLIVYLPLNDVSGAAAVDAFAGNDWEYTGNPALNQFPGPGDGQPWALFDGVDDSVDVPVGTLAALNAAGMFDPDELTVIIWAQNSNPAFWTDASQRPLLRIGADGDNYIQVAVNKLGVVANAGADWQVIYDLAGYAPLAPFCVAFTLSRAANKARLYFNGAQVGVDKTWGGAAWAGVLTFDWTEINSHWSSFFPGYQGRFALFNRALTATELADLGQIQSTAFLAGFTYRQVATVTNAGAALTNYPVKLTLTSSNFDFSRARAGGQDIRVTAADGVTILPHWLETYDSGAQTAIVWVRVSSIPAGGSVSLWLYAGKPSAADIQDGSAVFPFFEDFDTGNTPIWNRKGTVLTDPHSVGEPFVLYDANPVILTGLTACFKMWYTHGWAATSLCYAESADGLNWTPYASNPLLPTHSRCSVLKVGGTFYIYTESAGNALDCYTSADGVTLVLAQADVIPAGSPGDWDDFGVANSHIWREDASHWFALYESRHGADTWKIGLATSPDGLNWTKYGSNPVMSLGVAGMIGGPWVWKAPDNTYWCWVHTSGVNFIPTDIFRYSSVDLHTWTATPAAATFQRITEDEGAGLDAAQVADACLVELNGQTYLFYSAMRTQNGDMHINCAIADTTLAGLVAGNEDVGLYDGNLSGTRWDDHGGFTILSHVCQQVTATDETPTVETVHASADYSLDIDLRHTAGVSFRSQIYAVWVDGTHMARYIPFNNGNTTLQERTNGGFTAGVNVGANGVIQETTGVFHHWQVTKVGDTLTLFVDGVAVGIPQTIDASLAGAAFAGLSGYNVEALWRTVRMRPYVTPEPVVAVG